MKFAYFFHIHIALIRDRYENERFVIIRKFSLIGNRIRDKQKINSIYRVPVADKYEKDFAIIFVLDTDTTRHETGSFNI